jgi:hypothetical protein
MVTIRSTWFRFFPTLVTVLMLTQRALAGDDSGEPEFDVVADEFAIPGVRFHLDVEPPATVREVEAYLPKVHKRRVRLVLDERTGRYRGDLPIPAHVTADELTIRIVAVDGAGRRVEHDLRVPVLSDVDCCDDAETCGLVPLHD